MDQGNSKKKVLYDGSCPMCTVFADSVSKSSKANKFEFINIHGDQDISKYKDLPLATEIHIINSDGSIIRNAKAILTILASYKYLGWVASVGDLPIIRTILVFIYNRVANNRLLLSRKLFWIIFVLVVLLIALLMYTLVTK